jgi:sulfonate transport system substrate-binding protein
MTYFSRSKISFLSSLLLLSSAGMVNAAPEAAPKELRFGYQKSAINLSILKQRQTLEKQLPNTTIRWSEFPAGPQILEALAVGSIDIGMTGDTPPIFAQAAGKALGYVGYEAAKPKGSAILVNKTSSIKTLGDLKGKRVALQRGSSAHYLLVQALKKAQLDWSDIEPIWLAPAEARAAFEKGAVDAWAIWDPYYAATEVDGQARVLSNGVGLSPNYTFYLAAPAFIKSYPDTLKTVINDLNATDRWATANRTAAVDIVAKTTGLNTQIAGIFFDRRPHPSPIQPLNGTVIQQQQSIADAFYELKLLPKAISISTQVWTQPTQK